MDRSGFCEPRFAAKARVSPLGSPSAMNMLASLVRRMFAFAYEENEFMLLQMKGLVWGTGQGLLRSPKGRNASRDGLVKLGWVHCLQYTLNCFQYTGWPKSRYTVIKLFFMCFEVTSSALYVAQK